MQSIVSYNHLGNNDGKNLSQPDMFRSKEISKSNVVDDMVAANRILYEEVRLSIYLCVCVSVCLCVCLCVCVCVCVCVCLSVYYRSTAFCMNRCAEEYTHARTHARTRACARAHTQTTYTHTHASRILYARVLLCIHFSSNFFGRGWGGRE